MLLCHCEDKALRLQSMHMLYGEEVCFLDLAYNMSFGRMMQVDHNFKIRLSTMSEILT